MADEAAGARRGSVDRRWQSTGSGPADGPKRGSRRRTLLLLLAALFLTLVSAAIVWILFIRIGSTDVYFLALGIGEYNARGLPVNPFVEADIKRLRQRFPAGMHDHPTTNSELLLRNKLKDLKDGLPPNVQRDTLFILYVSALAAVRDGKVHVLPADADSDKKWLDVQEIIDALTACPAKKKLLILDLAHSLVDPSWGILSDRVAETLEAHLEKNAPPFPVLCSCSAGQTSLASEMLQGSVFAYYLDLGLQGQADRDDKHEVALNELAAFVKEKVNDWAMVNRGQRQEPRLFFKLAEDFPIVQFSGPPPETADPKPAMYPEALMVAWKERDRLIADGAVQRAPRPLRRLEANLQRFDDRWRNGVPPQMDEIRNLKSSIYDFARAMEARRVPPRSLPLAGAKEDVVLVSDVVRHLESAHTKEMADKNEHAKAADELVKLLKVADEKKAGFAQQAWTVVQALSQMKPMSRDHLLIADAALTKLLDALAVKPALVEVVYLRRLAQFAKKRDLAADSMYGPALLQTMRAHQSVIAALDRGPEPLPWIRNAVDDADQKRRRAEAEFLGTKSRDQWPESLKDLQSAKEIYDGAKLAVDALQSARLELDRACATLPAFAQLLCDWPEEDAEHQKAWERAADEARTLQAFFVDPPPADPRSMEAPAQKLRKHLDELAQLLAKRIDRGNDKDTGKKQQQLLCLLASPLLKAGERDDLGKKQALLAAKLLGETLGDTPPEKAVFPKRNAAPQRGRMSLAMLGVAGIEVDPKILDVAAKPSLNAGDLATLERSLRDLWGRDFPDPFSKKLAGPVADRLNRSRSPWGQHQLAERLDEDPTHQLQIRQRADFVRWLQASYKGEIGFVEPAPQDHGARDFYVRAAEDLRP